MINHLFSASQKIIFVFHDFVDIAIISSAHYCVVSVTNVWFFYMFHRLKMPGNSHKYSKQWVTNFHISLKYFHTGISWCGFIKFWGFYEFGKAGKIGRSSQRWKNQFFRSSRSDVFLKKDILKICSKFRGEHPCRSVISIKLLCNFIEIALC